MWANEQVQSWRGSRASITFDCDEVRRNAIINQFDRDNIRDEPLKVRERRSLQRTLEHMIARANGRNDRKRGNLLDRINRSMTSIAMMFARENNQGNQRRWGSPDRTKKKQQSTSLWLLLCISFGLRARIPALTIHKRFVKSGWTQQPTDWFLAVIAWSQSKNGNNNLDGDDVTSKQCVPWWLI